MEETALPGYVKLITCGSCTEANSTYWSGAHVSHSTECVAALKFHRSISNKSFADFFRCLADKERFICVWFYELLVSSWFLFTSLNKINFPVILNA